MINAFTKHFPIPNPPLIFLDKEETLGLVWLTMKNAHTSTVAMWKQFHTHNMNVYTNYIWTKVTKWLEDSIRPKFVKTNIQVC